MQRGRLEKWLDAHPEHLPHRTRANIMIVAAQLTLLLVMAIVPAPMSRLDWGFVVIGVVTTAYITVRVVFDHIHYKRARELVRTKDWSYYTDDDLSASLRGWMVDHGFPMHNNPRLLPPDRQVILTLKLMALRREHRLNKRLERGGKAIMSKMGAFTPLKLYVFLDTLIKAILEYRNKRKKP